MLVWQIESAKVKIREAMETLTQLSCEEPPDNGRTMEQLESDTGQDLDNASHTGQWAWLLLRDALTELHLPDIPIIDVEKYANEKKEADNE